MAAVLVEVRDGAAKDTGSGADQFLVDLLDERVTVAELIRRTVLEHIRELLVRRRIAAEQVQQILERQYLTAVEIDRLARKGKVAMPSPGQHGAADLDGEAEVQKALDGFRHQAFFVFVDGRQATSLDEEVSCRGDSKAVFLRVIPLVGG
jgi:hypothetical protein